jgi:hypothetical protein
LKDLLEAAQDTHPEGPPTGRDTLGAYRPYGIT